ncbi:helix-turn-helix transcriptional regulator [Brucella anthropi]|uniref:helix-turn-helix transcriptional regulator n=1 Tax=Brucella anthropi TaxID=529 RepID=UPI00174656FC|nr:helix-turn-helix transcriptional regulator [Brucella anthropi]QOD67016.1 helix-turn-helix transcriptional regulator [Ochrobactrum sp. MT180101]
MYIDVVKLDHALDRAVEAAFDTSMWKEVISDIAVATGSFGANIIPVSRRNPSMIVHTNSMDGPFEEYFNDGWFQNEWRLRGLPFLKRDGVVRDQQYTSREAFEKHGYFKLHAKYGIGSASLISWSVNPDDPLILTLHGRLGADASSDEEVAIFMQMRERLMFSARIMQQLARSRVDGMSDAFEMAGLAALFFDRFGKIIQVTTEAETMLGTDLTVSNRELKSQRHNETSRIREQMQSVIDEKWLLPDPMQIGPVLIERDGKSPLMLRIQRLGGNLPDFFANAIGVALLDDPDNDKVASPEMLRMVFKLTPKEADIVNKLCQGMSLREIADCSNMSYETVRTHLKLTFSKTKTSRQSELVALASKISLKT